MLSNHYNTISLLWQPQSMPNKAAASKGLQALRAASLLTPAGPLWRRPLHPSTQPLLLPRQPCCARQLLPLASWQAAVRRWHSCRGSCGKPMNRCWLVLLPADLHCKLSCCTPFPAAAVVTQDPSSSRIRVAPLSPDDSQPSPFLA